MEQRRPVAPLTGHYTPQVRQLMFRQTSETRKRADGNRGPLCRPNELLGRRGHRDAMCGRGLAEGGKDRLPQEG